MNAAARRKSLRLTQQSAELMIAAPQVVAVRVRRLTVAAADGPAAVTRQAWRRPAARSMVGSR